ncbi:uncharacterized protein At3g60930, chloroplastic-like [Eutrema salsugineum]|uniref:uncharacterized protein At3g60930, chloroplastic-like n=1 Tax=Eutrema salsugineum TaxID=72664 RepID=UPI000CED7D06|nr:uncharacterized protein At3g60930, chloroplastic-like [Eutrema salsugineum]
MFNLRKNRELLVDIHPLAFGSFLPSVRDDLFFVRDTLVARKVNWRKHFSFERVESARAIFTGVSIISSSSNSSGDMREKMVIFTLREKKRREVEEVAGRADQTAPVGTEVVPRDDLPKLEGSEAARATEENAPKVTTQEAAPEVEPGEIIPEASRENSAARSKTPPASSILALPKQSRPPASNLLKHDVSRKRSATEKGKGVATQKNEPSKNKCKSAPSKPASYKLFIDDPAASAVMLSRVNNANTRLPPPEQLRRSKSYAAMAQRGTKFIADFKEMMAGYESDLVKDERCLEKARKEAAMAKRKLDETMAKVKKLEEEKIALRANVDKVSSVVTRLEESRRAKSAEVALLKRRIETKDAMFDAKVKRAKKEARHELTAKFQERLAKVEKIKSNLAMIDELRKPDGSTLDAEGEKLKGWEAEYVEDEAYERIASEIQGELVFSPVSSDSVDTRLGIEPIQETAANLGVEDPTGSNTGTPALSNLLAERGMRSAA